jgi:hypothetical protein
MTRLLPYGNGWGGKIRIGKIPDRNNHVSGKAFALPVEVEPHVGQKWNVTTLPLSALRFQIVDVPSNLI